MKGGGRVGAPVRMAKGGCTASSAPNQVLWDWCRHQALRTSVHSSEECLRVARLVKMSHWVCSSVVHKLPYLSVTGLTLLCTYESIIQ